MKELNLPNVTLIALVASCFIQIGAQLFALVVIASTVAEAPPRSFVMFEGNTVTTVVPFGVRFP